MIMSYEYDAVAFTFSPLPSSSSSSSSFLQSVSIRIFQLYRNSVIRTCIASERIITVITWVITSTTYKPWTMARWMVGWLGESRNRWTLASRNIPNPKFSHRLNRASRTAKTTPSTCRICVCVCGRQLGNEQPIKRPSCNERTNTHWPSDFSDPFMTSISPKW